MIRTAGQRDTGAIAAIWNDVIRSSAITFTTDLKSEGEIGRMITERCCLVAEADGQVVGFATYGPFRNGPGYRFVGELTVYLRDGFQGRGLGRALLMQLEDQAASRGIDRMVAGMQDSNVAARAFHTALGYVQVAHLPEIGEKFGERHGLILMLKNLEKRP